MTGGLESTFCERTLAGFIFDDSSLQNQMMKVTQIFNQVWPALRNGILDEPETVLRDAVREAKRSGLQDILEELKKQLQEYLDEKNNL